MSLFVVPKMWSTNEVLTARQLNELTAAVSRSANSIVNDQVDPAAAIVGTKLADNSVQTSQVNDLAATLAKLAVGASVNVLFSTIGTTVVPTPSNPTGELPRVVVGGGEETRITLLETTQTVRGGLLLGFGGIWGERNTTEDDSGFDLEIQRVGGGGLGTAISFFGIAKSLAADSALVISRPACLVTMGFLDEGISATIEFRLILRRLAGTPAISGIRLRQVGFSLIELA